MKDIKAKVILKHPLLNDFLPFDSEVSIKTIRCEKDEVMYKLPEYIFENGAPAIKEDYDLFVSGKADKNSFDVAKYGGSVVRKKGDFIGFLITREDGKQYPEEVIRNIIGFRPFSFYLEKL